MAKFTIFCVMENLWGDTVTIYEHSELLTAYAEYEGDDGAIHHHLFCDADSAYDWAFRRGFRE